MKRTFLAVAVAMLLVGSVVAADRHWIAFTDGLDEARLDVARSTVTEVEFEVELPGLALAPEVTEAGDFVRLTIPGLGRIGEPGEPELPALRRFVEIPEGAEVEVDVVVLDRQVVELARAGLPTTLYPAQRPQPKCDCEEARSWRFSYKPESYRGAVGHPESNLRGPFTFRDHRMVLLTLAPVTYDVEQARLEVVQRARVTVRFTGGDVDRTVARKERLASRHFDAFLLDATINLNLGLRDAGWSYPDDAPVQFLIITPPQFAADLEPFVEWKRSTGFDVTVATTDDPQVGTTTTSIKSYITGLYNGANPPVYILMIGDSPSPLPTYFPSGGGTGGTDLPFVQMDPGLYPDMMIARWPIDDSTELINMRDKILHYEQPTAANSGWLNRALYLAGMDYEGTVTTHEEVVGQLMQPPPNSAECDIWYNSDHPSTNDLINDLNSGRAWAVYSGHCDESGIYGDPPFHSPDLPNLDNTDLYPLGVGHCCLSNQWNSVPDVFGEVTVTLADRGFVSYWGGSNETYWDEDDWLEKGFFDSMFDQDMAGNLITLDRQYSNIAACYSGLTEVTLRGGYETYYWPMYNLNGDPTLDPFTRQPIALDVGAPAVVPAVATDDFEVMVTDAAVGPVPLAMVGVSQNGTLLGAGMTDDTGTATFHIDAPTAGSDLLVRVTAHNHLPTDATVIVAAGSDGVVVLDRSVYRCDSTVLIDVFDDDLGGQGTVSIVLSAQPSGGSTSVVLSEVAGDVVRFSGVAVLGTDLTVADGDTLVATYHDADTGGGIPGDKTDSAVLDCAGPQIGDVELVATEGELTVRFTTDEPGTTVVYYGTTVPPAEMVAESGYTTDHELTIPGLDPCTRYYVGLESADALGNVSVETNGGMYFMANTMGWQVFLSETFDADPGWAIDNGGNGLGWAFGQPTGGGGEYGEPDPTAGFTGSNVYGVNLSGDYDNNLSTDQLKLTTASMDLSLATSAVLSYRRWLGIESPSYDHSRVQLSVDGGPWTTVWENSERIDGGSWVLETIDLSAAAAGHSDVRIRWTLGSTDSSWRFAGWNLDDVLIEGAFPCPGSVPVFSDGFETGDCSMWSFETP